ncbi:uncharacterized protein RCC_07381 [Ramularia collo-cygni]|uniref:Apple domain-containing protein n=1 Tax=Ramularia collo-cygni TaxID=112498 RepID=A0A2D3V151_9PEZI|nr:uncharacterized protein RCC_07381 [Ramularia collo-cygni]CZT21518.1 uncharacterized protein RCC_07381 [Ramularia collo-cygni]
MSMNRSLFVRGLILATQLASVAAGTLPLPATTTSTIIPPSTTTSSTTTIPVVLPSTTTTSSLTVTTSSSTSSTSPTAPPTCTSGTILPGTTCTQECGIERSTGDYKSIDYTELTTQSGFQACARACSDDKKCLTAQYRINNRICYMKNSITAPVANKNINGVVCRTCAQGSLIPGTSCRQECNVDRPGGALTSLKVTGPNPLRSCAEACVNNPQCLTAELRKDTLRCFLKMSVNDKVANTKVDGVICRSPVSSTTPTSVMTTITTTTTSSSSTTDSSTTTVTEVMTTTTSSSSNTDSSTTTTSATTPTAPGA